jgi:hypothetical protein
MNAHPKLAVDRLRSAAAEQSKLKAWRKRQMIADDETGLTRPMRITDAPRLYGVPWQTWHNWEQMPGHKDFKCPNADNMRRLCVEITKGELKPEDFYPIEDWEASVAGADGAPRGHVTGG